MLGVWRFSKGSTTTCVRVGTSMFCGMVCVMGSYNLMNPGTGGKREENEPEELHQIIKLAKD